MLYDILYFFGRAICHQLEERSFIINNMVMPICARCTGIYIGIFSALIYIMITKRYKANMIPTIPVSLLLFFLISPMAYDGISSYLHLRPSDNFLRIITGMPFGIVLPFFLFPLFNYNESNKKINRIVNKWYEIIPPFIIAGTLGFLTYKSYISYYIISTIVIMSLIIWFSLLTFVIIKRIRYFKQKAFTLYTSIIFSMAFLTMLSLLADMTYEAFNIK